MTERPILSSMTRISDLARVPFQVESRSRDGWAMGDYVVGEIISDPSPWRVELVTGRMVELSEGDLIVGALGRRYATLEATGSWEAVDADGRMELLTGGGIMGRCTSRSSQIPPLPHLNYTGHVVRDEGVVRMSDFVSRAGASGHGAAGSGAVLTAPTVMIVGTSMSAGKTAAARTVIRRLVGAGRTVAAAKVTGAGRFRDILTMWDSGADPIFDFVDEGLPSTVCSAEEYRPALEGLLTRIEGAARDAVVVEVGASPLEPYNGALAAEALAPAVRMTILCASDPYAVIGLMEAFGTTPDLVTGIASNTRAGVELVERLSGVPCLNVRNAEALPELDRRLEAALGPWTDSPR